MVNNDVEALRHGRTDHQSDSEAVNRLTSYRQSQITDTLLTIVERDALRKASLITL